MDSRRSPSLRSNTTPAWALWILRFQVGVVYVYGGIAKLDADWMRGEPLRQWMASETDFPLIGHLFTQEWIVWLFSWGGLAFDLIVVPALLWRRTRVVAFAAAVAFHLINARLFSIGIFPWMMIAATLLFFSPSWPRIAFWWPAPQGATAAPARTAKPKRKRQAASGPPAESWGQLSRGSRVLAGSLAIYVVLQLVVPFRHLLYPGPAGWTEEGHRFSWRMKLRDKEADASFEVIDASTGERWIADPWGYLTDRQARKMSTRPDMILQFGHYLADRWAADGRLGVEVRADVQAVLNDRDWQPLIEPVTDLAAEPRGLASAHWIAPLIDRAAPASLDAEAHRDH